jgi:hypothetical protein
MWRVVLVALCLAVAACGAETEGEGGACAAGIVWNDTFYVQEEIDPPRPPAGAPLEDGIRPGCNDSNGGPFEEDVEIGVREVEGTPPEVAVYLDDSIAGVYVNQRYLVFLGDRDHPPPRSFGRPSCTFEGTVVSLSPLRVDTQRRTWRVRLEATTRFARFASSIPYLAEGDRVRIRGHRCAGKGMIARRVEALP